MLAAGVLGGTGLTVAAQTSPTPPQGSPRQAPSAQGASAPKGQNSLHTDEKAAPVTGAATAEPRPFMGTVLRRNAIYVLPAGDVEYQLDDPDEARDYVDQSMGTFDQPTNTIQVRTIERLTLGVTRQLATMDVQPS
jgi:hypothetical protein